MKTQKILISALVAGVTLFFMGYLIYGVVLAGFMTANCSSGLASMTRPMDQFVWGAMIASNLIWGLLLALILNWSNRFSMASGAVVGGTLGLLSALGFDLSMYSMTNMYSSFMVIVVDSLAFSTMFIVAGLLTGWVMGKMNQPKAT